MYQETYDPGAYFHVHAGGPKRDLAGRLETPHRAARAGFDSIGMGILLGLTVVAGDLARLVRHAEVMAEDFPNVHLAFSLPRLRKADPECDYRPAVSIDDDTFVKALLFLRLRFPTADITVTTREEASLRAKLLSLGVTRMSAGVSTSPGGYAVAAGQPQFQILDERTRQQVADEVCRAGLVPD